METENTIVTLEQLVSTKDGTTLVSGRLLHKYLDIKRDFPTWIRTMLDYGFAKERDYYEFSPKMGKNAGKGRPKKEYALKMDMAKEICMIQRSEKGRAARQYFIECEKRLHEQPQVKEPQPTMTQEEFELRTKEVNFKQAELLNQLAEDVPVQEYKQVLKAYAAKSLVGSFILPLPEAKEKMYSPTEIAKLLGCSANFVGKLISKIGNLRDNPEYSKRIWNKSQYSDRQVVSYVYTEEAVRMISEEYDTAIEGKD